MDYVGFKETIGVEKGNVLENLRKTINDHERRISELERIIKEQKAASEEAMKILHEMFKGAEPIDLTDIKPELKE